MIENCCQSLLVPDVESSCVSPSVKRHSPPVNRGYSAANHLVYLDGLRGVAALYVVLCHYCALLTHHVGELQPGLAAAAVSRIIEYGHYAVAVFIVLSGYVLMMPVVRSADITLRGGFSGFIKRRAQRLLPSYYIALFLFSGLIYLAQVGQFSAGNAPIRASEFVEHLFLVHNLDATAYLTIDTPMWSLATEWQIYFVFALLLLPIYRHVGIYAVMVIALILGLTPHFILPAPINIDCACPWYLALFSCGMFSACVSFGDLRNGNFFRLRVPWGMLSGIGFLLLLTIDFGLLPQPLSVLRQQWLLDIISGCSTAAFLLYCTGQLQRLRPPDRRNILLELFQSKTAVGLGSFSYSLYLFHYPLVGFAVRMIHRLPVSLTAKWVLGFGTLPLVVAACYLFYCLCERPFMRKREAG